jgi:hypothetical protein
MVERGNPVYGGEGKPCPWWIDRLKYEKCHGFAQKFNMATTAGQDRASPLHHGQGFPSPPSRDVLDSSVD